MRSVETHVSGLWTIVRLFLLWPMMAVTIYATPYTGQEGENIPIVQTSDDPVPESVGTRRAIPRFVIGPPGNQDLAAHRQLITQPEQWETLRPRVGALLCTARAMIAQHADDGELETAMQRLRMLQVPLEIEVGALKEWGKTGEATYHAQTAEWDRILGAGGDILSFAMDEPLICARERMDMPPEIAMEFAATETATFVELVSRNYPGILIGDVEGYPYLSADEIIAWIDLLESRLRERGVRGLDFFRLDIDTMHFIARSGGDWHGVRRIEEHCRQRGLPLSVVYWAANYPAAQRMKIADDRTWYAAIMQMGFEYAYTGGKPDQYVIESWVGAPEKTLPETDPFTFTGSSLDFVQRYVPEHTLP